MSSQILSSLPKETATFLALSLLVTISMCMGVKLHITKFLVSRGTKVDVTSRLQYYPNKYTHSEHRHLCNKGLSKQIIKLSWAAAAILALALCLYKR